MRAPVPSLPCVVLLSGIITRMSKPAFRFEETVHGVSIDVLPLPFYSTHRAFMLIFATFWNAIVLLFWVVMVGSLFTNGTAQGAQGSGSNSIPPWAFLLLIPHTLIGIGVALYAIHLARLRIIFDVVGDTLLISKKGLRGVKQTELARDNVREILVAQSRASQNGRAFLQLEIQCQDGAQHNLLTPHSDACTQRVAELLNEHFMRA